MNEQPYIKDLSEHEQKLVQAYMMGAAEAHQRVGAYCKEGCTLCGVIFRAVELALYDRRIARPKESVDS